MHSLGAILLLRKKNRGWVGSSNAYNCLFTVHKLAIFDPILLIMWVCGFKNGEKCAYVIKVWPLIELLEIVIKEGVAVSKGLPYPLE